MAEESPSVWIIVAGAEVLQTVGIGLFASEAEIALSQAELLERYIRGNDISVAVALNDIWSIENYNLNYPSIITADNPISR